MNFTKQTKKVQPTNETNLVVEGITFTTWNTGREYSKFGQRIICNLMDNGYILFYDIDRMIEGVFKAHLNNATTKKRIMAVYDNSAYFQVGEVDIQEELKIVRIIRRNENLFKDHFASLIF